MSTRALLLGAGFSHNFGLPLAKDLLMEMFNKVKSAHLKNEILARISEGNSNFEDYYAEKMLSENSEELVEINAVLVAVYKEMDKTVVRSFGTERFSYIKVISFINKFSKNLGGCGYVFTLNQDILVERLFVDSNRSLDVIKNLPCLLLKE